MRAGHQEDKAPMEAQNFHPPEKGEGMERELRMDSLHEEASMKPQQCVCSELRAGERGVGRWRGSFTALPFLSGRSSLYANWGLSVFPWVL